jgi:DNA-binding Xre family transcriptional regulator
LADFYQKERYFLYNSINIAENIKIIAIKKKVTLKKMLSDCGLGLNAMSALNKGSMIAADSLAKIADYLDVSVDFLLSRTDNPNSHKTKQN